jgi:hypothetical protein
LLLNKFFRYLAPKPNLLLTMEQINFRDLRASHRRGFSPTMTVAILAVSLLASFAGRSQVTYTESFDGTTFVPTGWTNLLSSGSNSWFRVTAGLYPSQLPHSGAGEARFDSYDYYGGVRSLITPPFSLATNTAGANMTFWMYRDNGYMGTFDLIDVFYNTAPSISGATLAGTINREISATPTVASNGWYQYSLTIPSGVTGTTNYWIFRATSDYGNDIYIDDIVWESYPNVCSGTPPTPSISINTPSGCPNSPFTINTSGATTDLGAFYQWQSSTSSSGPFSAISGATLSSFGSSTSTTTYYRMVTTCTNSSQSSTTSVVSFSVVNPGPCVCTTYASASLAYSGDEEIINFRFGTLNNASTCSTTGPGPGSINQRYSNYAGFVTAPNVCRGAAVGFTIQVGTCGGNYGSSCKIYIDYNQNGSFGDTGEQAYVTSGTTSGPHSVIGTVTIPLTALTGVTRLRVINYEGSPSGITHSGTMFSWGEVEDYCINVLPTPSINMAANTASVCPAASFSTTATGALTYTVNGGPGSTSSSTINFNPVSTTIYTVTGTDAFGCVAPLSTGAQATITTLTAPNITITPSASNSMICVGQSATLTASGANTYTFAPSTVTNVMVVNPSATTVYTVSGTGTTVCNGVRNFTLTVNPLPTVAVNTGTSCAGTAFTLTPTGAATYTYTGPGTAIVSPTTTTTYSVTGFSSFGCSSASPAVTTITVIPLPVVSVPDATICTGSSYLINPSGASSYNLFGVFNPVTPTATSVYSVTGTSSVGCVSQISTYTVTLLPLPTVAVTAPSLICSGQTVMLTGSGGVTYTWSTGANTNTISVTPTTNVSYYVVGTGSNGCTNVGITQLTVNPTPAVSATASANFLCKGGTASLTAGGANTYVWNNSSTLTTIAVSPTVTTTYSVTGTNTFGCSKTATVAVVVNSIVPTITPPATVCIGTPVNLVANGGITYTWSGSNSNFNSVVETPTVTSTYSVLITDANSCSHVLSTIITVNSLPTIVASAGTSTVCLHDPVVLTATGANTYTWSNGIGTGPSVTITAIGNNSASYTVTGIDANGCMNSGQVSFAISACTGINGAQMIGVSVFPNPTKGSFFIVKENNMPMNYRVHDVSGRLVTSGNASASSTEVNLGNCVPGVYFVTLDQNGVTRNLKIVKD